MNLSSRTLKEKSRILAIARSTMPMQMAAATRPIWLKKISAIFATAFFIGMKLVLRKYAMRDSLPEPIFIY